MKKIVLIFAMFWALSGAYGQAVHTKGEKVGENGTLVDSIVTESSRLINYVSGTATPVWTDANDSIPELRTDIDTNTATGVTNGTNISSNSISISTNASGISDNADTATSQRVDINNKGDVHSTGVPLDNQLAIWVNDSTIEGDSSIRTNSVGILTNQVNEATANNGVFIEQVEFIDKVIEMVHGIGRTPLVPIRSVLWANETDGLPYWTTMTATYSLTGGNTSDSISNLMLWQDTINAERADTLSLRQDLWHWTMSDSSQMQLSKKFSAWRYSGLDSIQVDSVHVLCMDGTPNFKFNIHWAYDITGTVTNLFTTPTAITSASGATSTGQGLKPDNQDIPPNAWIWFTFTDLTAKTPSGPRFSIKGRYF